MTYLFTHEHPDSQGVFHADTFNTDSASDMGKLWRLFSLCSEQPDSYQRPKLWRVTSDCVWPLVFTIWGNGEQMTVDVRDRLGNFCKTIRKEGR